VEWTVARYLIASFRKAYLCVRQSREGWPCVFIVCGLCMFLVSPVRGGGQTSQPASTPVPTASSTSAQILSSYEGQNVTAVQIAGRPGSTPSQFASAFAQKAGQPFSREKVDRTEAALKAAANCDAVRVQVEPDANGARVIFVLEPAVYFGIFQFPGAERFNYSRLVQVANYPTQTPFNAEDVEQDRISLAAFFQQQGYFQSDVRAEVKVDS
jgi:outer membrane protein insertion porin family